MPIPVIRPVSSTPIILTPAGGSHTGISGMASSVSARLITILPIQILGFVPLNPCNINECRKFEGACYNNPVFGTVNINYGSYENDLSNFFIFDDMRRVTIFTLQKLDVKFGQWNDAAVIGSSLPGVFPYSGAYGTFYNYNHFSAHVNYIGVQINWGHVLALKGSGIYRLQVSSPAIIDSRAKPFPYCLVSEPFDLKPFNCNAANTTVKFEANQSGRIGSITADGYIFDICNMVFYDSIRVRGFFGFETTSYDEILRENQTGLIDRVRDEAIQKFDFIMHPSPKYVHDRFKSYGMMADYLFVSDYNLNNSDYDIKLKRIVKAAGYEPKYYKGTRLSSVKTQFKEGIQSVIKSTSCQAIIQ